MLRLRDTNDPIGGLNQAQSVLICLLACHVIVAEVELAQTRSEAREAHEQTEYLSKQWAEMHSELLAERNLHEVNVHVPEGVLFWDRGFALVPDCTMSRYSQH